MPRLGLRIFALAYLAALLVGPVALVAFRAVEGGLGPALDAVTSDAAIHAFGLTGGNVRLCWDPAVDGGLAPPSNLTVCTPPGGATAEKARGPFLKGYKVYRSSSPGVTPTPSNLIASVPPTQTTIGSGVAPWGRAGLVTRFGVRRRDRGCNNGGPPGFAGG